MFHHLYFPRLFFCDSGGCSEHKTVGKKPLLLLQFVVGWPDIFRRLTGLKGQCHSFLILDWSCWYLCQLISQF